MSIGGIGGPEGPKGVNNINGNNGVDKTTQTGNINSAFGQGFAGSNVDSSPISFLVNKFDFDIPKYLQKQTIYFCCFAFIFSITVGVTSTT